jgi:hypothetical protein
MTELCMCLQHNCTVGYATHQRSSMELTTYLRTLRSARSIGEECIWEEFLGYETNGHTQGINIFTPKNNYCNNGKP